MRIEVGLILDIADVKHLHIVFDQREGDDQWGESMMIISDHAQQFGLFSRIKYGPSSTPGYAGAHSHVCAPSPSPSAPA